MMDKGTDGNAEKLNLKAKCPLSINTQPAGLKSTTLIPMMECTINNS